MNRLRPRSWTVRLRLTVLYAALFVFAGALLLGLTYLLVRHNLNRSPWADGGNLIRVDTDAGPVLSPSGDAAQGPQRIQDELRQAGLDYAARDRDYRETLLRSILNRGAVSLGVVGVLAFALGWIVSGRVLRPLDRITATAGRIAATPTADRGLHERIALAGPADEIKRLADTFDTMLERLDQAFEGQRRFIANAAHELRTPLVVNRSLLETAMTRPAAPPAVHELGRQLLDSAGRQERLIDCLLTLARSENGVAAVVPVDVGGIAEYAADMTEPAATAAGVSIVCEPAPALSAGDPVLLEQLALNLVSNGVHHNLAEGGKVWVTTRRRPDGRAELTVSNTGPHVEAEAVERIFEPFRRLGRDRTGAHGGVGLGLSIVQAVARAHGGTVEARPRPGGGLTVAVTLPLREAES